MSEDKRVWMFRKGESKLFNSPEEVPQNEGWKDSPAAEDPPVKTRKSRMAKDEYVKLDGEDDGDGS